MIEFSMGKSLGYEEEGRRWYDTIVGINNSLVSLETFNQLIEERHRAGYDRRERLNEFYVLKGRYSFDTCGNCGTVSGIPQTILDENIPTVVPAEDFRHLVKVHGSAHLSWGVTMDGGKLPRHDLHCPHCGEGWTIDNCWDIVECRSYDVVPLSAYIGRTLAEVKLFYRQRTDAIYQMQSDIVIRNDRFIDRSLKYPNATEEWEKEVVKNETGWVDAKQLAKEAKGGADFYVIQLGDEAHFNTWTYYHRKCNREHLAAEEEKMFRGILERAGFQIIQMTAIPNEYCPCERCAPWFDVETQYGLIHLGWRKRVVSIDWSKLKTKCSVAALFQNENVTKGDDGIHARGWEKVEEYLRKIAAHLAK